MSRRRGWRDVVLNLGAGLGALCIAITLSGVLLDVTPLVFRSGSMSPEIRTGALALARGVDADEVREGDVVSVLSREGVRITHRVVSAEPNGDTTRLILKGDANPVADQEPYDVTEVDRVLVDVPWLGHVVSTLSGPVGLFLAGVLVSVLAFAAFGPRRTTAPRGGARRAER